MTSSNQVFAMSFNKRSLFLFQVESDKCKLIKEIPFDQFFVCKFSSKFIPILLRHPNLFNFYS